MQPIQPRLYKLTTYWFSSTSGDPIRYDPETNTVTIVGEFDSEREIGRAEAQFREVARLPMFALVFWSGIGVFALEPSMLGWWVSVAAFSVAGLLWVSSSYGLDMPNFDSAFEDSRGIE